MTAKDLDRFREAQDAAVDGYASALRELRAGHKRGHWIWYVMPQIEGLGQSAMSQQYAIRGRAEARAYLEDPVLSVRLVEIADVLLSQLRGGVPLETLMGSDIDALKTVSSMTLFERVAGEMHTERGESLHGAIAEAASGVLAAAISQGYPPCAITLKLLSRRPA